MAIIPPQEVRDDLADFLEPRRESAPVRWSDPDQVHVTLAFLEDVAERKVEDLIDRLERTAGRRRPVSARIAGGGAFPHVVGARVLWAGLELDDADDALQVTRMAQGARAAANRTGTRVDGGRFRPHLTIARTSRPTELTNWVRLLDAYRGPEWTIDSFSLIASHLGEGPRGRPRHEVLAEFAFD